MANDLISFFTIVVLVSSSGVLSPGPLFLANISHGLRHGYKAGILCSVGHTLVELPLVVLISLGIFLFIENPLLTFSVGIVGGLSMMAVGSLQAVISMKRKGLVSNDKSSNLGPLAMGAVFTAFNPFFIIWWFTVGAGGLVLPAVKMGAIVGVFIMYAFHIWMDYTWLTFTAHVAGKVGEIVGSGAFRGAIAGLGIMLAGYGLVTLLSILGLI